MKKLKLQFKNKRHLIVIFIVVLIVCFFIIKKNNLKWTMFYYPDGCLTCESEWVIADNLKSESECQRQIEFNDKIYFGKDNKSECGKNCKLDKKLNLYICEITKDY